MTHEGQILVALLLIGAGSYPAMFEKTGISRACLYTICNRLRYEDLADQFFDSSDGDAVAHRLTKRGINQAHYHINKHPDHPLSKEAVACGKHQFPTTEAAITAGPTAPPELSKKAKKAALDDHIKARRDFELTVAAIDILTRVTGAARIVSTLRASQKTNLERINTTAKKLGAALTI